MNQRHLKTLEFPQILARLARHVSFSAGKALALALTPSPVLVEVRQRLQETREARHLLDTHGGLSLGGAHDVRQLAHNAGRGALLQPADLLDILSTLRVGRRAQRMLGRLQGQVPLLADIAARVEPCEGLADEIGRCINDHGEVVDHASDKLSRIRRELRTAHERLLDKLNRIIGSTRYASYLQESLITQRSGRYVVPIKADFKGRIPGIVHDTSASGATLFIEPLSVVEMANRWRELQIEEEKEDIHDALNFMVLSVGIGAEYAFSEHFTVGGEYGIRLVMNTVDYSGEDIDDDDPVTWKETWEDKVSMALGVSYTCFTVNFYW